jgi:hypothetical protein
VERAKDRCLFRLSEKATIFSRFVLGQKSRMLRAIFVPLGRGGCRFSHHWKHPVSASSSTTEGKPRMAQRALEKCGPDKAAVDRNAAGGLGCVETALLERRKAA